MSSFKLSIAITSCVMTLLNGAAFAIDLHLLVPTPNPNPGSSTAAPGQTGSNVLASCGATLPAFPSIGVDAKTTTGVGSPFNPDATKKYAGNPGNPATNPKAVASQAALHSQMP